GVEEHGRQGEERKKPERGDKTAHLFKVKIVADADAPVVGRIAVDSHAKSKECDAASDAGKGAEQHGAGGQTAIGEANLAATGWGQEDEGQCPHGYSLNKEQLLERIWAKEGEKPDRGEDGEDEE